MRSLSSSKVAPLLLFSGFCALIYQVAWLRSLRDVFGASTSASAAVLAVFMAGLGSGGMLLGKRIERAKIPLFVYANLEILIGISACATPLLVQLARTIYLGMGGVETLGQTGATIVRLLLTVVVLGIPTVLMGGTLPAAARAVTPPRDHARRAVALLYGANTIGAVCGALAANFILLEVFGTRLTLWLAALVNLLVGFAARFLARTSEEVRSPKREASIAGSNAPAWIAPVAAGVSGFGFLLMELVWYRMLTPLLGGTSYTFGLILAIALAGIGIGGIAYSRTVTRPSLALFGVTCALEAVCVAFPFALGDRIAVLAILLRPLGSVGFLGHVSAWSMILAIVVLPASLVAGFQFPLSIALFRADARIGRNVALAYAANTIGSIVGSLAGGFGLLPLLSAPRCWELVVVLFLVVALAFAAIGYVRLGDRRRDVIGTYALALVAFAMLRADGPTSMWRHSPIGAGRTDPIAASGNPNALIAFVRHQRRNIRWQADGVETAVGLSSGNSYDFIVGGKSDGNAIGDASTQIMSGLIGAALRPDARRSLVVGLGTGSTAGWLAAIPSMTDVDVVEIEPAIVHVAEACAPINEHVLDNPKMHLRFGDARETLLTTKQTYDLVFSEPSNPYRAGISSFFTQDFYRAAIRRLSDDGIFLQWFQTYEVEGVVVRSVLTTIASVFPYVTVWETQPGDALLVGTKEPLVVDLARLRTTLAAEPFRTAMRVTWGMDDAEGFIAHHLANNDFARNVVALGMEPNTDDRNALEYSFARTVGQGGLNVNLETWGISRLRKTDRPRIVGDLDWNKVEDRRLVMGSEVSRDAPPASAPPAQRAFYSAMSLHERGKLAESARAWTDSARVPQCLAETRALAEALAEGGTPEDATRTIDALAAEAPSEAPFVRARLLARTQKFSEAVAALEIGFRAYRSDPWIDRTIVQRSLPLALNLSRDKAFTARLLDALSESFVVSSLEEMRRHTRAEMVSPVSAACVDVFAALEPSSPWEEAMLERRYQCYNQQSSPLAKHAQNELMKFIENRPTTVSAGVLDAPYFSP